MIHDDLQALAGMATKRRVSRRTIDKRLGRGCWAPPEPDETRHVTFFRDAHTSGVEAPPKGADRIIIWGHRTEAIREFIDRFGVSPEKTGCPCCGSLYSVQTFEESEIEDSSYLRGIYKNADRVIGEPDDCSL